MERIPTLDLRRLATDTDAFVSELGAAYRRYGFCCFRNHGIDASLIDEAYAAVVEGRTPLHDGPWSLATLEVCLAILESAKSGHEVALHHQVAPRAVRLP